MQWAGLLLLLIFPLLCQSPIQVPAHRRLPFPRVLPRQISMSCPPPPPPPPLPPQELFPFHHHQRQPQRQRQLHLRIKTIPLQLGSFPNYFPPSLVELAIMT